MVAEPAVIITSISLSKVPESVDISIQHYWDAVHPKVRNGNQILQQEQQQWDFAILCMCINSD